MAERVHFTAVAGSGMSALAQIRALAGDRVTGSDRLNDRGQLGEMKRRLEAAGIGFFPQDGGGIDKDTARVVASTAVEDDNADLAKARALGVKIVHRADELASLAQSHRTVAVAGTSGKSTVTAMIFHILEAAGKEPSLANGATVPALKRRGLVGNAWGGKSDLLVMEADESDGTLVRYSPALGVLLNVSKDHKEVAELLGLFRTFKKQSEAFVVSADAPGLEEFHPGALTYGFHAGELRGSEPVVDAESSRFTASGVDFRVPVPGRYNADNALAAAAAAQALGVDLRASAAALASYETVGRRFESLGSARGVEVIDDFAHNPDKVKAAIAAARLRAKRVLAVFQLHGFAPARFMKSEFIAAFTEALRPEDALWLPDVYYVGGTAAKDISSRDYAEALTKAGRRAFHAPERARLPEVIAAEARERDLVLVMGARDPSLSDLAAAILARLKA